MPPSTSLSAPSDHPSRMLAWCYFLTFFVLGLAPAALGPTLLALAEQTGSELGDISILFSMRSLGYLCSARIIGGMYDKHNGHPIMAGALSFVVVLFVTLPYISSLGVLSGAFLFHGILSACIDLGGNILLIWAYHKNSAPYVNGLHFSFGLGAFTAPLIVAATLTVQLPPVYTYWIIAALGIPSIIWLLRSPSPHNPLIEESDEPTAPGKTVPVWLLAGFFFLYGGSEVSLGGWIHTYGIKHNQMDEKTAAYLTSSFWGAFTLGRLFAIRLSSKVALHKLVLIQMSGAALCVLVLLLSPPNTIITWGCTLLVGLCMSSVFPLAITYFKRFTAGSGQLSSWFWIGASAGSMTVPWTIGQFFDTIGPTFFTLLIVICLILATSIMYYISQFIYTDAE
ncbi:MAG: MFS transporter [Bacteroidota bacterium]